MNERRVHKKQRSSHPDFDLPSAGSISGRTSSITAAFFQAITPVILPTEAEIDEALVILGMSRGACCCAYCGGNKTEWDHFRPTVVGKMPTGYITEIANLVPACGKCNQSKGNRPWQAWMESSARLSPGRREDPAFAGRVVCLQAFERWRCPIKIDYESLLGSDNWTGYLSTLDEVTVRLGKAQAEAAMLRAIADSYVHRRE